MNGPSSRFPQQFRVATGWLGLGLRRFVDRVFKDDDKFAAGHPSACRFQYLPRLETGALFSDPKL